MFCKANTVRHHQLHDGLKQMQGQALEQLFGSSLASKAACDQHRSNIFAEEHMARLYPTWSHAVDKCYVHRANTPKAQMLKLCIWDVFRIWDTNQANQANSPGQ